MHPDDCGYLIIPAMCLLLWFDHKTNLIGAIRTIHIKKGHFWDTFLKRENGTAPFGTATIKLTLKLNARSFAAV